jgi:trehalose 6-phosphate phosphatase
MSSGDYLIGPETARKCIEQAQRIWLFLDYDGTLADFAPTPDDILPDPDIIHLIAKLKQYNRYRIAIISGRRLSHIQDLVPVEGILLAGTYGLEILTPEGKLIHRLEFNAIRPTLEAIKPNWESLIHEMDAFYLEDKGWTLALHARFATQSQADPILSKARQIAERSLKPGIFHILGGDKFLEVGPNVADKGLAIDYVLEAFAWQGALPVYVGDDDKDEAAFTKINEHNGISIVVALKNRKSHAVLRLKSPQKVRQWLNTMI